jgi:LDH2 family malate/lactate/ureidoglycolate dehydrogenase
MLIAADVARAAAVDALVDAGAPLDSARTQADLLIYAETVGLPSHGLLRLPRLIERIRNGVADPVTAGEQRWNGDALLLVNGCNGLGPVVARAALDAICERTDTTGVACAAISSSNHLGALAWYVRQVASVGKVCIAFTTSEAIVHPHGGRFAMVGSNPIAIGVPAHPEPLVLDMATSVVPMGKVLDYANRGVELEPGWARDASGEPTTNPHAAKDGSIAPFAGAKGYGLGIALEVLVAALTGAALGTRVMGTLDSVHEANKGDLFVVADVPWSWAVDDVSAYLDEVRSSSAADPSEPVTVPGDRSGIRRRRALEVGIVIPGQLWERISALATPRLRDERRSTCKFADSRQAKAGAFSAHRESRDMTGP